MNEKTKQAKQTIDQSLADLGAQMDSGKSESLIKYLDFVAKFHSYSWGNIFLALSQMPEATRLAGYQTWRKAGRQVRKGAKGITILAPCISKVARDLSKETEIRPKSVFFRAVSVFDVSQTDGPDMPEVIQATGDGSALYPAIQECIRQAGIALDIVENIVGGALGVSRKGSIQVRADLGPADGFRTLTHELAHEKLHWAKDKDSKLVRETEADATAYVVCKHFSIECDTSDYLLMYNADSKVLKTRLDNIRKAANEIIQAVKKQIGEMRNDEKRTDTPGYSDYSD